uniref:MoaD/ThiS family protein n=1 Tax=candidate division WOR-3 bacterium TaxID=2052148 RepID=A0A7C4CAK9_UNCW3
MVTVKLFGMTKMMAGNQATLSLDVADGRSVKDVIGAIEVGYPDIGALIQKKKVLVSVNQEIAHDEALEGLEVGRHDAPAVRERRDRLLPDVVARARAVNEEQSRSVAGLDDVAD